MPHKGNTIDRYRLLVKQYRWLNLYVNEAKKQVDELALEIFEVKLDRRVQKQILIQAFMNAQKEFHKKK